MEVSSNLVQMANQAMAVFSTQVRTPEEMDGTEGMVEMEETEGIGDIR